MNKKFLFFDGRAKYDEDEATVMGCADSEKEAIHDGKTLWNDMDGIWFEYDEIDGKLMNGVARWDLPPNNKKGRKK